MKNLELNNRIWIEKNGKPFLGHGRIILLEKIDHEGSINRAAKSLGMSYKRAWQLINAINEVAEEPIVERVTGGAGGGGTVLTEKGRNVISDYHRLDELCKSVLEKEAVNCCF
jgi:molybdate transport system regulatory protein